MPERGHMNLILKIIIIILKTLPASINYRLSQISSSQEMFDKHSTKYQEEIHNAGYKYILGWIQIRFQIRSMNTSK